MVYLRTLLLSLIESCRFLKHRRERASNEAHILRMERARERQHQMEMQEAIFSRMEASQKLTMEGFIEMAKGSQKQAEAFHEWLRMFQSNAAPESSTVRDSDEWLDEQKRLKAQGFPVDLPIEFQLASVLHEFEKDDNE